MEEEQTTVRHRDPRAGGRAGHPWVPPGRVRLPSGVCPEHGTTRGAELLCSHLSTLASCLQQRVPCSPAGAAPLCINSPRASPPAQNIGTRHGFGEVGREGEGRRGPELPPEGRWDGAHSFFSPPQKRRRPTLGVQLDDKRKEMLKRHPLCVTIDLKCKGRRGWGALSTEERGIGVREPLWQQEQGGGPVPALSPMSQG